MIKRRRRVLVQVNSLEIGGSQINAVDLAVAVQEYGYDSVVFGPRCALPQAPSLLDVARRRGLEVIPYDLRPSVLAGGAIEFERRARAVGAELIHIYSTFGGERAAFWGPCFAARRPLVHTIYEMSVSPQTHRHTSLIVGTGYLKDDLATRPGPTTLISPPVDVVANAAGAVNPSRFVESLGDAGSRLRIVVVSRLDESMKAMSIEVAMRAILELRHQGLVLVVVGGGDAEQRLRALGAEINATAGQQLVHFAGAMSDPRAAYESAHIVLGMGSSAARALSFGKPLVVLGEYGCSELFTPATAKQLFRRSFWNEFKTEKAAAQLAAVLEELTTNGALRAELGKFGRSFAISNYGLSEMAARLATVYEQAFETYRGIDWLRDMNLEAKAFARKYLAGRPTDPHWFSPGPESSTGADAKRRTGVTLAASPGSRT